jgi:hypothetical protein
MHEDLLCLYRWQTETLGGVTLPVSISKLDEASGEARPIIQQDVNNWFSTPSLLMDIKCTYNFTGLLPCRMEIRPRPFTCTAQSMQSRGHRQGRNDVENDI